MSENVTFFCFDLRMFHCQLLAFDGHIDKVAIVKALSKHFGVSLSAKKLELCNVPITKVCLKHKV